MSLVDPIALTQELVRIPSVNPIFDPSSAAEAEIGERVARWARAQGLDVELSEALPGRPNVVVRLRNGADRPNLMLCGHLDTVSIVGMRIDPFAATNRDGRLWGRGTADMKGPIACMLAAAAALRDRRERWRGTLTLGLVVDEEYRFRGVSALIDRIALPDWCIVGEPTSLRVLRGCKGCLRFAVEARGRAAHSSDPSKGRSAIVAMSHAVLALERFFAERLAGISQPDFGVSTGSIGMIQGGTGINIVPEKATIHIDVRLLPGQDWRATYGEIQQCVRAAAVHLPDIVWSFPEPDLVDPPFVTETGAPLVRTACSVLHRPAPEVAWYGCDASKVSARGVPSIIAGPGDIAQAHTADEWIANAELERAANAYVALAEALMPV
jgi:acetylornithine deacetylase